MSTPTMIPRLTIQDIVEVTDLPRSAWHTNTKQVAHDLVRSGLLPTCRVVVGFVSGVEGEHSWVTTSWDVYDKYALIVDPTMWTFRADIPDVWMGTLHDGLHHPKGEGFIWDSGYPENSSFQDTILLPQNGLSTYAKYFLSRVEPLNVAGWTALMRLPMQGWPAGEILARMKEVPTLAPLVPEDLEGMLTEKNPGNLYL